MNIDIPQLQSFLKVVEHGNFTTAAESLGRTQSAISQQVAQIEKAVGTKILNRSKPFKLTKEGEVFFQYAKQIVDLHATALSHFKDKDVVGDVKFGVPEDFASLFLSEILARYCTSHPNLHLNIECDLTLNLYERFKQGEFDLALVKMSRPEDVPHATEIWSEKLLWVLPKRRLKLAQDIPLILSPQPCIYREHALRSLDKASLNFCIRFSSMSHASKIAAVEAGMGITVLPKNLVPSDLKGIPFNETLPTLDDIQVTLLQNKTDHAAVTAISNYIREALKLRK
ncbi:MAG: LysR family transcriptional regulator [Rickettsiales bacterium]|nr:LysR family transcriptional regulator [Rickettsiales bacterium]|tara:strand:+ start:21620 stop:22471 length:852 start_codon:yes stop_codon:yes gene_type:complete